MDRKKFIQMYEDAVVELFNKADDIAGMNMIFDSFDDIVLCCRSWYNHGKREKLLPFECFYLDENTQNEIVKKYTDKCTYHWVYPHKIQLNDKKFDEYIKDIEEFDKEKKNLTRWFRNKRKKELIEKWGLKYRSREAESLAFSIWDISPSANSERFEELKRCYSESEQIPDKYLADIRNFKYFKDTYNMMVKPHVKPR